MLRWSPIPRSLGKTLVAGPTVFVERARSREEHGSRPHIAMLQCYVEPGSKTGQVKVEPRGQSSISEHEVGMHSFFHTTSGFGCRASFGYGYTAGGTREGTRSIRPELTLRPSCARLGKIDLTGACHKLMHDWLLLRVSTPVEERAEFNHSVYDFTPQLEPCRAAAFRLHWSIKQTFLDDE